MTAAGITRIISQLTAAGRDGGVVTCPHCDGGSRRRRTLSINLRDGVWLWLCHRGTCAAKGAVAADPSVKRAEPAAFTPKPLREAYRLPLGADPIVLQVAPLIDRPVFDFAKQHGLRVVESEPSTSAWLLRDVDGRHIASVTRTRDKRITTYREIESPVYGWFPSRFPSSPVTVIVEDPLSAALCAESGVNAVALCGTTLSPITARQLRASGLLGNLVLVALDADEAGKKATFKIVDQLRALNLYAGAWLLKQDVKNTPIGERDALVAMWKEHGRDYQP